MRRLHRVDRSSRLFQHVDGEIVSVAMCHPTQSDIDSRRKQRSFIFRRIALQSGPNVMAYIPRMCTLFGQSNFQACHASPRESLYLALSSTYTASSPCAISRPSLPLANELSSSKSPPSSSNVGPLVSGWRNQMMAVSIANHATYTM